MDRVPPKTALSLAKMILYLTNGLRRPADFQRGTFRRWIGDGWISQDLQCIVPKEPHQRLN